MINKNNETHFFKVKSHDNCPSQMFQVSSIKRGSDLGHGDDKLPVYLSAYIFNIIILFFLLPN